jgi:hypothetical protein
MNFLRSGNPANIYFGLVGPTKDEDYKGTTSPKSLRARTSHEQYTGKPPKKTMVNTNVVAVPIFPQSSL